MEINEIIDFLLNKPGYLKEGSDRLRSHLYNRGFVTSKTKCKIALRQARTLAKENKKKLSNREARILIYDIETSPNIGWFWRAGYKLNVSPEQIIKERGIICISYKWLGQKQVYNLSWDNEQDDKFLTEQFIEILNEADLIVAHNGDNFDLKWIKTRAIKHGLNMLVNYPQFDTLKVAKKKFNFNSNRLDYITKFLGFEGKIKTDISLWTDIMLKKCPIAMEKMLTYCDEDVRQLEKVYNILSGWENPMFHLGVLQGKIKQTSPISGSKNLELVKDVSTNRGTLKRIVKDLDTGRLFEMSNTNYLKYVEINK
jgi:predicted PolB exonuclease-like 3'-5' exonuclease|tara:strand:+ start:1782 stop:2717 length:936 start_codon:yes stop_codon:yes gene_type:complete